MIDYSKYEFTDLQDTFEERLKDKQGWGNLVPTSMGQTLIELNADASDYIGYMLERRIQELYLQTAKLETSVFAVASSFGYRPRRSIGASGTLKIELQDNDGNSKPVEGTVTIPKFSVVTGGGETFFTTSDIQIQTGETQATIPISEGDIFSDSFDPTNQSSTLYYNEETGKGGFIVFPEFLSIDENYFIVESGNEEYEDVFVNNSSLAFEESDSASYYVYYSHDGMRIQFGGGKFGKTPTGDVNITWAETKGSEVRVSDIIDFSFEESELEDDNNTTPTTTYNYTLKNVDGNGDLVPISGGQDFESVENVKVQVPLSVRSNFRAVTTSDYNYWVNQGVESEDFTANVLDINVFSEFEEGTIVSGVNNVYVSYFTDAGDELTSDQKQTIRQFMEPYKVSTTHIVFVPAKLLEVAYDVRFKVKKDVPFSNANIKETIKDAIDSNFGAQERKIGNPLYLSEMTEFLQNYEVTRDGITYNLIEYLDIDAHGVYWLSGGDQYKKASIIIDIPSGQEISQNDVFAINIDGSEYTYTATQSYTNATNFLNDLRNDMMGSFSEKDFEVNGDTLTIEDTVPHRSFQLSVSQNNDIDAYTTIERSVFIPIKSQDSSLSESNLDDGIFRGELQIYQRDINGTDVLVYQDDGQGVLTVDSGFSGNISDGTINYKTGEIVISLLPDNPDGYYVYYKQNEDGVFQVKANSYIDIIRADSDTLSTITVRE